MKLYFSVIRWLSNNREVQRRPTKEALWRERDSRRSLTRRADAFSNCWRPTRRRELACREVAAHFDISKPTLSHHLATLKAAGLVTDERHGQNIVYSLNTTVMQDLIGWFLGFTEDSHE